VVRAQACDPPTASCAMVTSSATARAMTDDLESNRPEVTLGVVGDGAWVAVTLAVAVVVAVTVDVVVPDGVGVTVDVALPVAVTVRVESKGTVGVPVTVTVVVPDRSSGGVGETEGSTTDGVAAVVLSEDPAGRVAIAANAVGDRRGSVVDATVDADALGGSGAVATEATVANGAGPVVPGTAVDVTAGTVATVPDASATGGGMTMTSRKPFAIRNTDNAARRTISMARRPTRLRPIFMMRCHPYAHRQFRK